jgi:hypothetical protein
LKIKSKGAAATVSLAIFEAVMASEPSVLYNSVLLLTIEPDKAHFVTTSQLIISGIKGQKTSELHSQLIYVNYHQAELAP